MKIPVKPNRSISDKVWDEYIFVKVRVNKFEVYNKSSFALGSLLNDDVHYYIRTYLTIAPQVKQGRIVWNWDLGQFNKYSLELTIWDQSNPFKPTFQERFDVDTDKLLPAIEVEETIQIFFDRLCG